jgi:hypothetical protein
VFDIPFCEATSVSHHKLATTLPAQLKLSWRASQTFRNAAKSAAATDVKFAELSIRQANSTYGANPREKQFQGTKWAIAS